MKQILVTGAKGFLGKNLCHELEKSGDFEVLPYDLDSPRELLDSFLDRAEIVFHLAGVNRPEDDSEFKKGNTDSTRELVDGLVKRNRSIPVVLSSSTQAELDNPYGKSKRAAEDVLEGYSEETGAPVFIFRLTNIFGKWCRPNYNSVVATFCHNIARDLPISISDRANELTLVYVDDVVAAFREIASSDSYSPGIHRPVVPPVATITLGELADMLSMFRSSRKTLDIPDLSSRFVRCLYATYISYLPGDSFSYSLVTRSDERGTLFELLKSRAAGQIFVSTTLPGVTRGNHFHETKVEKFCVLSGKGVIRFRSVLGGEVISYPVSGATPTIVDIPPGYTHSIENIGDSEMVVLFWASEKFDPERPDTCFMEV